MIASYHSVNKNLNFLKALVVASLSLLFILSVTRRKLQINDFIALMVTLFSSYNRDLSSCRVHNQ
jgi:hypothetical protein